MSRIGKNPITVPDKVTVTVNDNLVTVKGPKGELSRQINKEISVELKDGIITVSRPSDDKTHRSLHGLSRTLINNMIIGVTEGYSKSLEIQGVGYRAAKQGKAISFTLGFSHPCVMEPPEGITFDVPGPSQIVVSGIDKEKWVLLPLKSAACVLLNLIKARESVTLANISSARLVKRAPKARSNF